MTQAATPSNDLESDNDELSVRCAFINFDLMFVTVITA